SGIRLVAGEPDDLVGGQVVGGGGVDVLFAGTLSMPGDVLAHFDCGMVTSFRDEFEVVGADATLFLDDPWHSRHPVIEVRDGDGGSERIEVEFADPYACELEELVALASGSRPARFGREDAVAQARAIEQLYAAAGS
ncbi:MAG: hypothetical protein AVDCRST_MAG69-2101, partial [uncultured Solirubrobacteraceae bacterium]